MSEVYVKKDGEFKSLGDVNDSQLARISNNANLERIQKYLDSFWTKEKLGKHEDLKAKHGTILLKDLKADPKDFFEQLNENTFIFQEFGPIALKSFLKKAKISEFVNDSYIDDCMKVVTPQPAIGRGEFLFAATFKNINFADGQGDLIDTSGNRIEVKGKHANFGGSKELKQMNQSLMYSVFSLFETNTESKDMTLDTIDEIQNLLLKNKQKAKNVFSLLQNLENPSGNLTNQMFSFFNESGDLRLTIAAAHFLTYMKIRKADFLLALNDNVFWGFKSPNNLQEAAQTMKNFNINGWMTGNKGISFTVKNG